MSTINFGDSQTITGSQSLEAPINVAGELNVSGELSIDTKPGISGIVTDSSNNPIENATVNLFLQDGGEFTQSQTTDPNGAYSFTEHRDATNSIQSWHVLSSYDDGNNKFFSRSKFGVRAALIPIQVAYDMADDISFTSVNDMSLSGGDTIYVLTDNEFIDSWVLPQPDDVTTATYVGRHTLNGDYSNAVGIASDYAGNALSVNFVDPNESLVTYENVIMSTTGDITTGTNSGESGKNPNFPREQTTSHLWNRAYPDDSRASFFDVNNQDDATISRHRFRDNGEELHVDTNTESGSSVYSVDAPCTGATMRYDDFTDLTLTDASSIYSYTITGNDPVGNEPGGPNAFDRKIDVSDLTTDVVGVCGVSSTDDFYHVVDGAGQIFTVRP